MDINSICTKSNFHNYVTIKQSDKTSLIELLLRGADGSLLSNLSSECTVTLLDTLTNEVRQSTTEQIQNGVLSFRVINDLEAVDHTIEITTLNGTKFPSDGDFRLKVTETHDRSILKIIKNISEELALKVVTQQILNKIEMLKVDFSRFIKKGEVTVHDIDKNQGLLDGTYFTDEFKSELSKGNINVTSLLDSSVTTPKITDRAVTPSKASFFSKTKNLFDGTYHRIFVSGAVGTTNAYLYNNDANRHTAIVPVVAGKTYYVKSHDASLTDNFRIGLNQTVPTRFDTVQGNAKIASIVTYNDLLKEASFTSDITGYAFITVSKSGQEPRLQVEEGTAATSYTAGRVLNLDVMPLNFMSDVAAAKETANTLNKLYVDSEKNIFDGKYYPYFVSGALGGSVYLYNTNNQMRTAIVPVVKDKQYAIRAKDATNIDKFRIAFHSTLPGTFDPNAGTFKLTDFVVYNDQLKVHIVTATLTGYMYVTVSGTGKEPLLQIEQNSTYTEFENYKVLNDNQMPNTVNVAIKQSNANTALLNDMVVDVEKNLFNGKYVKEFVSGSPGTSGYYYNNGGDSWRTAIAPVTAGKTYTITSYDKHLTDAFRVAVHRLIPTEFDVNSHNTPLTKLLEYNDSAKTYTFIPTFTGYVFVTVSKTGKEPRLQIEEGQATAFAGYQAIHPNYLQQTIANIDTEPMPLFPKVANMQMIPTEPGARFVEYFDGKMWGYTAGSGNISYSTDDGKTWVVYARGWNHSEWGWINRLMKTADGEVVAMTGTDLRKSSGWSTGNPTWSENKITKHAGADLFQFSLDGNGTKFIVCEYSGSSSRWSDSRFVWISTDKGETWKVVWDTLEKYGEEINATTHLHAVCYDKWSDRFYFSEGHGRTGGLYCSTDNGTTWVQSKGYRDGVLKSLGLGGAQYPELDTNGPTVIIATPTGLVMGSDNANNGMFGLVRKPNPKDEVVVQTYATKNYRAGLSMFAIRGWYDEVSDSVIITFRAEFDEVPPIICAGTPTKATMIYEYPNLPVRGGQDLFGAVAKTSPDRLVAYAQFGGVPYTVHADLVYPASEIKNIIYQELKKYKLI